MNILKAKRTRYYLRLAYPLRIVLTVEGFFGSYPDLPGCSCVEASLPELYREMELTRRRFITERVLADLPIAAPNSHGSAAQEQVNAVA